MPSSGLHSNGYTLARKVLAEAGVGYGERPKGLPVSVGEALLEPTRIYVQQALRLVRRFGAKGLAHISGGGLWNLPRLKESVEFRIEEPLIPPPIIELLSDLGDLDEAEMYQTFNMGMGMAAVVPSKVAEAAAKAVGGRVVGTVARGRGVSVPPLGLRFGK
jgi:phosphoribosylformylglycinamidine cyclo-ligase